MNPRPIAAEHALRLGPRRPARLGALAMLAIALTGAASGAAWADGPRTIAPTPAYQQACAECHIAYPPSMLPAASWQRLMAGLDRHFGSNASVDAATVQQLSAWLQANASDAPGARTHDGEHRRAAAAPPPQDRITRSAWFLREHREVAPEVWKRAAVRSPANCSACHAKAEQGDFDEHRIRIPR